MFEPSVVAAGLCSPVVPAPKKGTGGEAPNVKPVEAPVLNAAGAGGAALNAGAALDAAGADGAVLNTAGADGAALNTAGADGAALNTGAADAFGATLAILSIFLDLTYDSRLTVDPAD